MMAWNRDKQDRSPSRFDELFSQIKKAVRMEKEIVNPNPSGPVTKKEVAATNRALTKSFGKPKDIWKAGARVVIIRKNPTHPPMLPPVDSRTATANRQAFAYRDQAKIWTREEVVDIAYAHFGVRKPPVRKPQTLDQLIAKAAGRLRRAS